MGLRLILKEHYLFTVVRALPLVSQYTASRSVIFLKRFPMRLLGMKVGMTYRLLRRAGL